MYEDDWMLYGCIALIVVLFAGWIASINIGAREWETFSTAHACKLVATKEGQASTGVGTGISSNGNVSVIPVTTYSGGQEAFLCNDGVTYWRNK